MPSSVDASYGSVIVVAESAAPTCMSTIRLAVRVALPSGPTGATTAVWLSATVVNEISFVPAVAVPTTFHDPGIPAAKPSNSTILSPAVAGCGSHASATPSPSVSGGASFASIGHG